MAKNKGGRPPSINDETVKELESAFLMGLNDTEACLYADISRQTLYAYQEKNPEFTDRKFMLRESVAMRAKLNLASSINSGDIQDSKWYLERKKKDEFSLKTETELTGKDGASLIPTINLSIGAKPSSAS